MDFFNKIKDWLVERLQKVEFSQEPIHLMLAVITGIAAGLGATAFYKMIQLVQHLMFQSPAGFLGMTSLVHLEGWKRFVIIPLVPALGGLIVGWMMVKLFRSEKGEGVPVVIENVAKKGGILSPLVGLTQMFGSAVSIGSGGAGGREGPSIAIGGAVGSGIGQIFRVNEEQMKSLVGCGAGAGLAAVFNAPIGGALFAMEVVLGSLDMQSFSPIIIASVFGTFIMRTLIGNRPIFVIPTFSMKSPIELVFYVVLGLFAGFVGVFFVKLFYATEEFFDHKRFPIKSKIWKPAIGGLIVGIIGIYFPEVFGYTYQGVDASLYSRDSFLLLSALLLMKPIATSVTLGSGGSGGTLAPSLFIGAMAGGAFGSVVNMVFPGISAPAGAYALVGMAAVTSATVQAPLSAAILVFEMTDNYSTILPILIAVVLATYISRKFMNGSIYTVRLKLKGQFLDVYGRDVNILRSLKVKDVMRQQLVAASESTRLSDLLEMIPESSTTVFPVIRHDGTLSGTISYGDIRQALTDESVRDLMTILVVKDILNPTKLSVKEEQDLSSAMKLMLDAGVPSVPVVRDGNQLAGMLYLNDSNQAYEKKLLLSEVSAN